MLVTNLNDAGLGSLRAAIAAASAGDTIEFAPSLANRTITLTSGEIFVDPGKNLTIDGTAAPNLIISGNNSTRIFRFGSNVSFPSSHTLRNLILANGFSADRGGAIQTEDLGALTVDGVTFQDNVAHNGGAAIWTNARSGGVTVLNSRFINNQATVGNDERGAGGIAFIGFGPTGSELVVRDSRFIGNQGINGAAINVINGRITIENSRFIANGTTAATFDTGQPRAFLRGYGGALYVDRVNDSLLIRNSVFEGNRGEGEGGAAYLFADPGDIVRIEQTVFRDNQVAALTGGGNAGNGGAIAHVRNALDAAGSFVIVDSSFVANVANNQGGGVWVNQSNSTIANSTFSGNQAPNNFGGAVTTYSPLAATNLTMVDNRAQFSGAIAQGSNNLVTATNTLFVNNTSTNTGVSFNGNQQTNRPMNNGGGNLQFPAGPELIPGILIADPQLGPLQSVNGTLVRPLQPGSPAIDAGVVVGSLLFDQRGTPRPQDGDNNTTFVYDVGAFEVDGILPPPAFITVNDVTVVEGTGGTTTAVFTLTRSGNTTNAVAVDFVTANGTATAGSDYQTVSGSVAFAAGATTQTVAVPIVSDAIAEPDETLSLNLVTATDATILDAQGLATIVNDDSAPLMSPTAAPPLPVGALIQPVAGTWQATTDLTLAISLTSYAGAGVSDVGLFLVDDDQGSINGLLPGAAGYVAAALQRVQTVFSTLAEAPDGFAPTRRQLSLTAGDRFRWLLAEAGSLDAARLGAAPAGPLSLFGAGTFDTTQTGNLFGINWNTGSRQLAFNIDALPPLIGGLGSTQGMLQGELIDLRTAGDTLVNFTLFRDAAFDNTLGVYAVENEQGAIRDPLTGELLLPGSAGYRAALLANRVPEVALGVADGATTTVALTLPGNTLYAPFLVPDGTIADAIAGLPVYTPFIAANGGNVDHVRLLADNTFGFEDLPGGGDLDYNDLVLQVGVASV